MEIVYIVIGLVLLFFGGEWLIKGAVGIALHLGLSTLLVSTVIIGFGTSTPELLVSIEAALGGAPDIAMGNVVGSNIANTLLIMGSAALITPVLCTTAGVKRDTIFVALISVALALLSFVGVIDRVAGAVMIAALVLFFTYTIRHERKKMAPDDMEAEVAAAHTVEDATSTSSTGPLSLSHGTFLCLAGLAFLAFGAKLLVGGAVSIAQGFGIPEAVIGLTLVAVGTSLPELAAAISAARKGHTDVVIGNVLGSNLYNILGILGITSLLKPIPYAEQIANVDVWVMAASALVLLPVALMGARKLYRWQGLVFLSVYAGYIYYLYSQSL